MIILRAEYVYVLFSDDDECTDGVDNCAGENVVCVNEFGGYNCKCLMGYMWTKDRTECEGL